MSLYIYMSFNMQFRASGPRKDFTMNTHINDNDYDDRTEAAARGDVSLERRLRRATRRLDHALRAGFADLDADPRDLFVLDAIADPDRADGRAAHVLRKTGLLHRFADRELIASGDDGWTLTDTGAAERERLRAVLDDRHERLLAAVGPERIDALTEALDDIAEAFPPSEGDGRRHRPHGRGRGGRGHHGRPHRPHDPAAGLRRHADGARPFRGTCGAGEDQERGGFGREGRFDADRRPECDGERRGRGRARAIARRAFERGFERGFAARSGRA